MIVDMVGMESSQAATAAPAASRVVRGLYLAAGAGLVAVGVVGILVPLLPTTIFLILAGGCFARSSPAAYRWLTTNRLFGRYLRDYREERGATLRAKIASIASVWLGIGASAWFFSPAWWVTVILAAIAAGVTVHLLRLRTLQGAGAVD